ncbi:HBS1-like protein isoform X1 [Dermacentor silvarum]|uniref:HBS1-like protein isoform X1 n=1 Tax=Dermacentor silvarum TaxID=543639 RepID=UPI001898C8FD|nr:HBS1-like protein isoform X1 [Dermacentor silvarum]
MSRHRNVRTMNYDDDYEGYYDVYGRSQEEDSCISPTTEEQFLYNRDKLHSMSSFLSPEALQEENEEDDEEEDGAHKSGPQEPELSPVDEVRLYECIEKMQNVVGDSIPEATLRRAALEGDFNAEVALDHLLQEADKPKPQREPRKRESDSDDDDSCVVSPSDTVFDGGGASAMVPLNLRTIVANFDAPAKCRSDNARMLDGGEHVGGAAVPANSGTESAMPSKFALSSPSMCTVETSGCELKLDELLKSSGLGESHRTDSLSKAAHSISGCDDAPPVLAHLDCETVPATSLTHASSATYDLSPNHQACDTDSVDDFLETLLQEGNAPSATSQRKPTAQASVAVPDELDILLGMVSSYKPRPATPTDTLRDNGRTASASVSHEALSLGRPTKDPVGDSLDALLGIGADSAVTPQQGGEDAAKTDFDDFLMSLRSDIGGTSDLKAQDDGLALLPIADILSVASSDEKGPGKLPQKPELKQPALLNLGEILGLNREHTPDSAVESGALKLDDILKGAAGSPAVAEHESGPYGNDGESPELSPLHSATAVTVKEASLFGKVLVYFHFVRRQKSVFDLTSWLRKLGLLEPRPGEKARTAAFNFGVPSPDDVVRACRKRAVEASERKPLTPLEQVGAPVRAAGANKELLPAVDSALRQTFPRQPQLDVEDRRSKASSETLKVPSATSSNRSSPDLDRKEPSPEAAGDTQPADGATPKTPRSKPPKDVAAEYAKERGSTKSLLNLVVIGHVDAGKSTLMGHLLYRLGCVQKKQMHKYEQESKKLGKASFMYAWVLDETSEERNRGITMDVAQAKFETPNRSIVLLDAPGHRDFIPNMITGAAQADVAILVVDATRGEFETGFETGGQTREHTLLVRSLGVSQLAVAINKLDNVSWDEGRYNEITAKLRSFLRQAGYRESDFTFVPCSGLTGENLTTKPEPGSPLTKWYTGPCLVDVIDSFKPPERPVSKPFRLCVSDVFKGQGSGFCVSGRIDAGCAANGDKVLVMPAAEQGTVKGITIDELPVTQAFAGDQVALTLAGVDMIKVTTGSFLCDPALPIRVSTRFQARLVVFNIEVPLTRGFPVVLHYQSTTEQASIHRIISQLNKVTGEVVRNKPRCLVKNTSGLVEIKVSRPICVELYKEFKELGRITLRSGGSTVAAGVITEVM